MELGEFHSLRRHAIQVGGGDGGMSVAADVAITHVIGEDENNVRWFDVCADSGRDGQETRHKEKEESVFHVVSFSLSLIGLSLLQKSLSNPIANAHLSGGIVVLPMFLPQVPLLP